MPRGDGTGPLGLGPMTGRAAGYCAGYNVPGYMNPIPGRGLGLGFGRGRGFGRGLGRGFGRGWWRAAPWAGLASPYAPVGYAEPLSKEETVNILKEDAEYLKRSLENIEKEIKNLEKKDN